MRVLHISDLHIVPSEGEFIYGVDSHASLEAVLCSPEAASPDLIIATGDLSEGGDASSYARLRALLRSREVPVLVLPGNHDSVRRMKSDLCDDLISFPKTHDQGGWRFVLLNSQVPRQAHGHLDDTSLGELEAALAEAPDCPTIVALHHSPIAPCPALGCQLFRSADFLEAVARHPNAKLVISGHSHLEANANFRGVQVTTTPSTCAQAIHAPASSCPDLEDFWASHSFDISKHGYRVLDLGIDGCVRTQVHWVLNAAAG